RGGRRPLGAQRAVVAVPGVEPGLVGQAAEDLGLQVGHQRVEVARVRGPPRAAGEQRVAGEQVRYAAGGRVAVEQGDRTRGVPHEVDDLQRTVADAYRVAVGQRLGGH